MTIQEAADLLGVKRSTVYELVSMKKLPHYRVGPSRGKIVLDRRDVLSYLDSCRVEASREGKAPPPRRGLGLSVKAFVEGEKRREKP